MNKGLKIEWFQTIIHGEKKKGVGERTKSAATYRLGKLKTVKGWIHKVFDARRSRGHT